MRTHRITDIEDPRIAGYRDVRDADLRGRHGAFLAEGRFILTVLLTESRLRARSILLGEAAFAAMRGELEGVVGETPVYVAEQGLMNAIVGFDIHRGCLALGERPRVPSAEELLAGDGARLVVGVEGLSNHDNMGGLFRNAAAFGAGAMVLTGSCCDPLYRKAIRVSMGHALRTPYARWEGGPAALHELGYTTIALTPSADAVALDDVVAGLERGGKVAVLVGNEGAGLTRGTQGAAGVRCVIPMTPGTDSLNTATAAGIALSRIAGAMGIVG